MDIQQFRGKHQGERCFILGNGPSLKGVDISSLPGVTFGSNRIYLSGFQPNYYVCVNPLVLAQFKDEIDTLTCTKFVAGENITMQYERAGFFDPFREALWEGGTVTYVAMQLAYYMGFTEVILLGVDHDYGMLEEPNSKQVALGPDLNHFDPTYFTDGVFWNEPDLMMSEYAYSLAKEAFEADGRKIINCSSRTKLDVFEVVPLVHELHPSYKVSAIVSAYYAMKYLNNCMENLMSQSDPCEIIVVCQDGSAEQIMMKYWSLCPSVKVITTPDIPNLATAWNIGIRATTGRYITHANADDLKAPDALELMANVLDARPDIDLVYANCKVVEEGKPDNDRYFIWPDYSLEGLRESCFIGPQPMWRANLHQRYGYFDESFTVACDYDFWLRCARESNYLHIPQVLGVFLQHGTNLETRERDIVVQENLRLLSPYHQSVTVAPDHKVFFSVMMERAILDKPATALFRTFYRAGQLGYTPIHVPYMHVHWARDEAARGFREHSENPNDVLIMMDCDHEPEPTILEKLANAPAEFGVVAALAFCRGEIPKPAMSDLDADGDTGIYPVTIAEHGLEPKDMVGTATIAIKRWVFDKISEQFPDKPFFEIMYDKTRGGEDWYFANLCREAGIQQYVLLDVETPHLTYKWLNRKTWAEWCAAHMERIEEDTANERNYKIVEAAE